MVPRNINRAHGLVPSVPSGTIAGSRHCSTDTIEGLLYSTKHTLAYFLVCVSTICVSMILCVHDLRVRDLCVLCLLRFGVCACVSTICSRM